jgi:hypothetical protein
VTIAGVLDSPEEQEEDSPVLVLFSSVMRVTSGSRNPERLTMWEKSTLRQVVLGRMLALQI